MSIFVFYLNLRSRREQKTGIGRKSFIGSIAKWQERARSVFNFLCH
jgi:hypothetical protein